MLGTGEDAAIFAQVILVAALLVAMLIVIGSGKNDDRDLYG
jgi:hypothetical protein